ncbi:MAG: hypothetical protein AAGU74_10515 [Bacillota bacterium]
MKRVVRGRANAFLIEMIIVVMLFALSSTVVLMLFTKAHQRSQQSIVLNESMLLLQSTAELIRAGSDAKAAFLSAYPEAQSAGDGFAVRVNVLGEPEEQGEYMLELSLSYEEGPAGRIENATLRALRDGGCSYTLSVVNYVPKEAAA